MEARLVYSLCSLALVFTVATDASRIVFPVLVTLGEGDTCTLHSGTTGRCVDIRHCDFGDVNFRQNQPVRCGFNGIYPVVCCPTSSIGSQPITDIAPPNVEFDCTPSGNKGFNPFTILIAAGSVESKPHAWPWMALIGRRQGTSIKWFCGGALINQYWILTASHCQLKGPNVVRLGEHDHQDTRDGDIHRDFDVAETVMYPGYAFPVGYHDLALLRLSSKTDIQKNIIPVCLPWGVESEVDVTGHKATLTGYGTTEFGGLPTTFLQQVNVTVFPSSLCDTSYSILSHYNNTWPQGIGEETLCAGDLDGGKDACQGDSGGPLVTRNFEGTFVLAGIVAQGNGCGTKDFQGLYVNMRYPPYLAWIKNVAF